MNWEKRPLSRGRFTLGVYDREMIIAYAPLLAAVIGMLLYALSTNGKVVELGRALLWCGILVTLLSMAHNTVKLG